MRKRGNCVLHYCGVLKNEELMLMILGEFRQKGISVDIPTKVVYIAPFAVAVLKKMCFDIIM